MQQFKLHHNPDIMEFIAQRHFPVGKWGLFSSQALLERILLTA
jgi:hypothetical protein